MEDKAFATEREMINFALNHKLLPPTKNKFEFEVLCSLHGLCYCDYFDNLRGTEPFFTLERFIEYIRDYNQKEAQKESDRDLSNRLIIDREQPKILPQILTTDEAKALFQKAIDLGFVLNDGNLYKWKGGTKELLAYFAEKMSNRLELSTKLDKGITKTINWKVFEIAFGVPKLKSAKYNWLKLYSTFNPNGYEKIDEIFD